MTVNKQQMKVLMMENSKNKTTLKKASIKACMTEKTARKYIQLKTIPPRKTPDKRIYKTRKSPFDKHLEEILHMIEHSPGLQAKTIFTYLQKKYPGEYQDLQIRTLQRLLSKWRSEKSYKDAKFIQKYEPGRQSQSDWTSMNKLEVTIAGEPYPHLIFHFILSYSRFETIMICETESFDTLTKGLEQAMLEIGGSCKEHRTDNLTAATQAIGNNKRVFTVRWLAFTDHYGIIPTRNNPGVSHENGKIEKSHDLFKNAVNQELLLRGSRNFDTVKEYSQFLEDIKNRNNAVKAVRFAEEQKFLKPLPENGFDEATILKVRVNPESFIQVLGVTYSVPSRLISNWLKAYVYRDKIDLFLGSKLVLSLPKVAGGTLIDYRHLIDSLVRKPGAFEAYQYKQYMFPTPDFRKTYDHLKANDSASAAKEYCKILYLAKMEGEEKVNTAIKTLFEGNQDPTLKSITELIVKKSDEQPDFPSIQIEEAILGDYESLLKQKRLLS